MVMGVESESGWLAVASTMTFTIYLGQFMRTPIVPLFAEELGATIVEVGLVTTAFMMVAAILAIPLGVVSDRLGRRRLVMVGSLISTVAPFLLTLTKSPATVIIVNACGGFGSAAYAPAMTAFVGDISKSDRRGKSYGYYTTAMQMAMALGPGVGGFVADLVGYHYTFIVSGLVTMVGMVVGVLFFSRSEAGPVSRPHAALRGLLSTLGERSLLRCWIATFCISFMWGAASAFLAIYAKGVGLMATEIGLLFTAQSVFNALGRLPLGVIYDRMREHTPMMATSLVLGALVTASITASASLMVLLLMMGLFGVALGATMMATNATIAESSSPSYRGLGMGSYYLFFYGGMASGPAVMGLVISAHGFQEGFRLTAAIGFVGAILLLLSRLRGRT